MSAAVGSQFIAVSKHCTAAQQQPRKNGHVHARLSVTTAFETEEGRGHNGYDAKDTPTTCDDLFSNPW